jgi:hypothetical protein
VAGVDLEAGVAAQINLHLEGPSHL